MQETPKEKRIIYLLGPNLPLFKEVEEELDKNIVTKQNKFLMNI